MMHIIIVPCHCHGLGHVHAPRLLLLFLLQRILLSLPFPAPHTLGGQSLVPKRSPRPKVLATLAPLDLKAGGRHDPNVDVAYGAQALVLGGNVGIVGWVLGGA